LSTPLDSSLALDADGIVKESARKRLAIDELADFFVLDVVLVDVAALAVDGISSTDPNVVEAATAVVDLSNVVIASLRSSVVTGAAGIVAGIDDDDDNDDSAVLVTVWILVSRLVADNNEC